MPITLDHTNDMRPCIVTTAECGRAEDAGVMDAYVPLPPGLQVITLTVEEAQAIRQVLDDETHPAYEGKEMPTADASVFRKNS